MRKSVIGRRLVSLITLVVIVLLGAVGCDGRRATFVPSSTQLAATTNINESRQMRTGWSPSNDVLMVLRGGASKSKKKKKKGSTAKTVSGKKKVGGAKTKDSKDAATMTLTMFKDIPLLTRWYMTAILVLTLLGGTLGEETAQAVLALDPIRTIKGFEIWRPITAATYLGGFSMAWITNMYSLYQYGSKLETHYSRSTFLLFIVSQVLMLSVISLMVGNPTFCQSMISAMLWVYTRLDPDGQAMWVVVRVPNWILPYALMFSDAAQAQSMSAIFPHIYGILAGHFFYFHREVWPKIGGEAWLEAPEFVMKLVDPEPKSKAKDAIENALKARKKGKGKKLGSA